MGKVSIKYKLFFCYSLLLVLSLFCAVLISQHFTGKVFREKTLQDHRRELTLITNNLQLNLNHISDYVMSVALDPVVIASLEEYSALSEQDAAYNDIRRSLGKEINSIIGMSQNIFQWDIATLDQSFLNVSGYELLNPIERVLGPNYFAKANAKRSITLNGPFMISQTGEYKEIFPVFVMSKQIVDLDTLKKLGYVAFFISEASLSSDFEKNLSFDGEMDYFILSGDNKILSSSRKEVISSDFLELQGLSKQDTEVLTKQGSCIAGSGKNSIFYTVTSMEQYGWRVVYATSMASLMVSQYYVRGIVVVIGAAVCMIALIMTGIIAYRITHPIVALSKRMSTCYAEEPKGEISYSSHNEIENLYAGFEAMLQNSQQLMEQIYNEQEEKSNYKFQLIQAQIKPHFLYNTFETIKSLVDIGMNKEASEAVMAVSKFYRMSLNDGNDITSVADEIELSRQYMYIQKLRYMEYLDYEIEECRDLKKYIIPKLTLQPLLENAIYHGIKARQEGGKISLQVQEKEECLFFSIEDDGMGIDGETLEHLNRSFRQDDKKDADSFGLYSINRRIQLFFGSEYGLHLVSEKCKFTCVTLTIPKMMHEKNLK